MADSGTGRRTKVERVLETYGLEEWGDRLEAEWLGEGGERTSLRDLAAELNRAIVRAALENARGSVVSSDVESAYRTLVSGDAPESDRIRKRRELERAGVDVDSLASDVVSHQAIHTYLRRVRDAEFERDQGDRLERKSETVQRLASRTRAVTDTTVEELVNAGLVTDRDYDVVVDLRVVCNDCGRDYGVGELFERGGCDCS